MSSRSDGFVKIPGPVRKKDVKSGEKMVRIYKIREAAKASGKSSEKKP